MDNKLQNNNNRGNYNYRKKYFAGHHYYMQQFDQIKQMQQLNHIQLMKQIQNLEQKLDANPIINEQKMHENPKIPEHNEHNEHKFNSNAKPFIPAQQPKMMVLDIVDIINPNNKSKQSNMNIHNGQSSMKTFEDILKFMIDPTSAQDEQETEIKLKEKKYDLSMDYTLINKKIKTIDDLLDLMQLYDETKPELMDKYTFDIKKLIAMKEPLIELKNMIGMETVKKSIVRQIIYFLQEFEEQQDMLHVVITGSPGTGKTSLGIILSKLYHAMGIIDHKESVNPLTGNKEDFHFKIYKRADLVGQYLGHTAIKTQKAIDECVGGVMFLDEAYSLGHDEKSDVYTKECVDTINQNLSENKKKFILIIAGYAEQLDKCFFAHNEGLRRRFAFRYDIEKYSSLELARMLQLKIKSNGWKLNESITLENIAKIINGSENMFKNFGGDIESWLFHIKTEHGMRIFGKHPNERKLLIFSDLENGLEQFKIAKENKLEKNKLDLEKSLTSTLYM